MMRASVHISETIQIDQSFLAQDIPHYEVLDSIAIVVCAHHTNRTQFTIEIRICQY